MASGETAPKSATKARKSKAISKTMVKCNQRNRKATAMSPVAVVWSWLATGKNSQLKRADAIAALVPLGSTLARQPLSVSFLKQDAASEPPCRTLRGGTRDGEASRS